MNKLTDTSQICEKLKQSLGNVTSLLSKKFSDLDLCKIKDDEKFVLCATRFRTCVDELTKLAENMVSKMSHIT